MILSQADGVTALGGAELAQIGQSLAAAAQAPGTVGVVLMLTGAQGLPPDLAQDLTALSQAVESFPKPIVAALQGLVGGAHWALALAAHYRFAAQDAQVVLPEVRLGLIAGGGTTQRLPRLIGAAQSIRLMLGAKPETAAALLAMGALDRVVEGDVLEAALQALGAGLAPRRTRDAVQGLRDPKRYLTEVRAFHERVTGDVLDVSRAVVKTVEAALLLPFARGLAFEAVTLEDLARAPETRAVRHAVAAERAARARVARVAAKVPAVRVGRLALWRVGSDRAGLVQGALKAGLMVVLADPERGDLVGLLNAVAAGQEAAVVAGTMSAEARDADWARLVTGDSAAAMDGADLILDATGDMMARLGAPVALLGKWSGGLALLPGNMAGDHAEIALPAEGMAGVAEVMDLARRLGWRVQIAGRAGFVGPALAHAVDAAVARLAELGHGRAALSSGLAQIGFGAGAKAATVRKPVAGAAYDIGQMVLAALANEAARLLVEGGAQGPMEMDAAALGAGILPRWMGGPLYQADQRGLILLRADLVRLGGAGRLVPSPLIEAMIAEGGRFYPGSA